MLRDPPRVPSRRSRAGDGMEVVSGRQVHPKLSSVPSHRRASHQQAKPDDRAHQQLTSSTYASGAILRAWRMTRLVAMR
jgi:hypothetical protein